MLHKEIFKWWNFDVHFLSIVKAGNSLYMCRWNSGSLPDQGYNNCIGSSVIHTPCGVSKTYCKWPSHEGVIWSSTCFGTFTKFKSYLNMDIQSDAGITTRSKSKLAPDQWTVIPLPSKVLDDNLKTDRFQFIQTLSVEPWILLIYFSETLDCVRTVISWIYIKSKFFSSYLFWSLGFIAFI